MTWRHVDFPGIVASKGNLLFMQRALKWNTARFRPAHTCKIPTPQYMGYLFVRAQENSNRSARREIQDWILQHAIEPNMRCAPPAALDPFHTRHGLYRVLDRIMPVTPFQSIATALPRSMSWGFSTQVEAFIAAVARLLDGGLDLSTPILFGLHVNDANVCDDIATGHTWIDPSYVLLETNVGFVLDSLYGFIANIDLGATEPNVAKLSAALKSCPRSIGRAVISNWLDEWRELTAEQKASLISFLERPPASKSGFTLPGLHQLMRTTMEEATPISLEEVIRDWVARDILWHESDERLQVPKMFECRYELACTPINVNLRLT